MGTEVTAIVLDFLNKGIIPDGLNHINIALTPKMKNAKNISHFRLISICNVVYKIASKILVNRLKHVLSNFISKAQSPTILLMHLKLIIFLKKKLVGKNGHFSLKIDMSKTYDRVEWSFFQSMMVALGFHDNFIVVVMRCVSNTSFFIVINGDPISVFSLQIRLRQGDPLFPYLFILYAERFPSLFLATQNNGSFPELVLAGVTLEFRIYSLPIIVLYLVMLC